MRTSGTLEVDVKVDQTLPGADKIAEQIDKRTDLILGKFMEAAQKVIFEPPPPKVEPAHASSGGGPWGVGLALNYRRDTTNLELNYHETRQFAYLQEHTISSSLEGVYDEIKRDPAAEKKYFLSVSLDDWPRKIALVFKPVVPSWSPIAFVSAQVGYPNTQGELQWTGKLFQKADGDDATWRVALSQKQKTDVANPPAGWEPDKTFIKRKVTMKELDDIFADPFVVNQIDQNEIDLDAGPNGVPMNDTMLEIRADSAGRLAVGPIALDVLLEDARQTLEVVFDPTDENGNSLGREQVRFRWEFQNQDKPRFWSIYTGDPAFRPFYRYKVLVTIKGSVLHQGQSWEGPWVAANGNGPITITVPPPDGAGVVRKEAPPIAVVDAKGNRSFAGAPASTARSTPPDTGTIGGWSAAPKPMSRAYSAAKSKPPATADVKRSSDKAAGNDAATKPRARRT